MAGSIRDLDDDQLLKRADRLLRDDRARTAELLRHIYEIDRRELWARQGYSSVFAFCLGRWNMTEDKPSRVRRLAQPAAAPADAARPDSATDHPALALGALPISAAAGIANPAPAQTEAVPERFSAPAPAPRRAPGVRERHAPYVKAAHRLVLKRAHESTTTKTLLRAPPPSLPNASGRPGTLRAAAWMVGCMAACLLVGCGSTDAGELRDESNDAPRPTTEREVDDEGLPIRRGAHVLLITVDALRADRLGVHGYGRGITPGIDAIAAKAVLFERAYAQAPHSSWSLASLMTGEYLHEVAQLGRPIPEATLASTLAAAGHETAAFFTSGIFYTDGEKLETHRRTGFGFETWVSDNPPAEPKTDRALEEIDRIVAAGEPPSLLWVHYFDPHEPYDETALGTSLADRYDGDVRNADRGVARLVRAARERLSRDVVVVITADHGEELRDHGGISHGSKLYDEQVRVPLVIDVPGLDPRRVPGPVELVDVAPTLLRLLGVEPPASVRGDDLRPEMVASPGSIAARPAFSAVAGRRAVVDWPLKLIADLPRAAVELYDLEADPGEREDLAGSRDHGPLRALIHEWHDTLRAPPGQEAEDDPVRAALDRGLLSDDRAPPALAAIVRDEAAESGARAEAARLLASLGATGARDALRSAMRSDSAEVSGEAAVALGTLGDARASRTLLALLQGQGSADADLRARAAIALGTLGRSEAVPALIEVLDGDRPYEQRRDAVRCLYRLRDPRAIEALVELTADSRLRYRAITALGLTGDPAAYEPLARMLEEPRRAMIRDGLVRALGWVGDPRALPRLVELAASEPDLIYATESLVRLDAPARGLVGGTDVGPSERGRRGMGRCERGDPHDLDYRRQTWCVTAAPRAQLRLHPPLTAGPALAVLSARRTDAETPASVTVRVGDWHHTFEVPATWTEQRAPFRMHDGSVETAVVEVEPPAARVALDHLLLLPETAAETGAPGESSAGAEEDAPLE